jgi:hypothetical protein
MAVSFVVDWNNKFDGFFILPIIFFQEPIFDSLTVKPTESFDVDFSLYDGTEPT